MAHCVVRISAFAASVVAFTGTSTVPASVDMFPLFTVPAGASIEFVWCIRCPLSIFLIVSFDSVLNPMCFLCFLAASSDFASLAHKHIESLAASARIWMIADFCILGGVIAELSFKLCARASCST